MSQELITKPQPSYVPRGLVTHEDPWNQPNQLGPVAAAAATQPPTQPLQVVHRVLRGRYILAIFAGLIGGSVGAYLGWQSVEPTFRATGQVEIHPTMPRLDRADAVMPMYERSMNSEATRIRTRDIVAAAMRMPIWIDAGGPGPESGAALSAFQSNLRSNYEKNSFNIFVTFEHVDRRLAGAGVDAILQAYSASRQVESAAQIETKLRAIEDELLSNANRTAAHEEELAQIAQRFGTVDVTDLLRRKNEQVNAIDTLTRRLQENIKNAQQIAEDAANGKNPFTNEDLARLAGDQHLNRLLNEQAQQLAQFRQLEATLAPNALPLATARQKLAFLDADIETRVAPLRARYLGTMPDLISDTAGANVVVTPQLIQSYQQQFEYRIIEREKLLAENRELTDAHREASRLNQEIRQLTERRKVLEETREGLLVQTVLSGRFRTVSSGDSPTISNDKRRQMAIFGFGAGFAVPVGLVMLLGLLDTRVRYSDETTTAGPLKGLTLLGILPNLPDKLSDPQQASIAAHCVHQIRTMLQLGMARDGSSTFAVTSAASGDGKTSLSLALGLSFAASGSRTLLIDSDLVGGGLSNRLGQGDSADGILDAVTDGNLLKHVHTTDVPDLAILPVGPAQVQHAGVFSPEAMRKLIEQARRNFEVVVIDTGPVMGAIEATPVCAAVDGVILTVSRGQSRPLVDKSLEHLQSIGARIAGLVFNRAQARDFERSISGMSVRSVSRSTYNGQGHNTPGPNVGPVARALKHDIKKP